MFSDTFAGIAPSSVPSFVAAQLVGSVFAIGVVALLYPRLSPEQAREVVVSHRERADQAEVLT
jgi:arsenate reductase